MSEFNLICLFENPVFVIAPEGKGIAAKGIGPKKIGENLNGTVNWQDLEEKIKKLKQKKRSNLILCATELISNPQVSIAKSPEHFGDL